MSKQINENKMADIQLHKVVEGICKGQNIPPSEKCLIAPVVKIYPSHSDPNPLFSFVFPPHPTTTFFKHSSILPHVFVTRL